MLGFFGETACGEGEVGQGGWGLIRPRATLHELTSHSAAQEKPLRSFLGGGVCGRLDFKELIKI